MSPAIPARPRRIAALLLLLLLFLGLVGLAAPHASHAAFEWDHPAPRSLIGGDSPARWPVTGKGIGLRADLIAARPWGWPGIRTAAFRIAGAGRIWTAGLAVSQLRTPAYRESRLAAGIEELVGAQRFAFTVNLLSAAAGEPEMGAGSGMEIDLGWSIEMGPIDLAARADGAFRTRGAHELGPPRRVRLGLGGGGPLLRSEVAFEEGSRGRRLGVGLLVHPLPSLTVGAAWSSDEPPVRLLVAVARRSLALSAGWAWHSTLPPSHVVALSHGSPQAEASSP